MDNQSGIIMYSTQWCGDCVRSKKVFDNLNIKFTEIDIDFDKDGYEIAKKLQNQNQSENIRKLFKKIIFNLVEFLIRKRIH